jgi:predicted nucleic acid-binding protein
MKKVLFDTNIILDIALKRNPYFDDASRLFGLIDKQIIAGNITATTITDIYYISKKEKGHFETLNFIINLIKVVDVIGVDKEVILNAIASDMKDFEDAIQASAAKLNDIEMIITRNKSDFKNTSLAVLSPEEFLENFDSKL